jgi:putative ABC transport system permease protein
VKQYGLDNEGKIAVYFPHKQQVSTGMYLVARTTSDPAPLAGAIVREIHAVDSNAGVYEIRTMQDRLFDSLARQRFATTMLGAFAVFALLLTAVGVYGVMSYLVSQSTHDIGLRVALGAQPGNIVGLVVRQGMALAAIGIVGGLIGSIALTRVMASLLFGVSTTDAVTFGVVPVVLAAVAFAATVIPALRATGVDPVVALREE